MLPDSFQIPRIVRKVLSQIVSRTIYEIKQIATFHNCLFGTCPAINGKEEFSADKENEVLDLSESKQVIKRSNPF